MNPPITPGEIVVEESLTPLGISQNAMTRAIGAAPRANNEIVLGRHAITPNPARACRRADGRALAGRIPFPGRSR